VCVCVCVCVCACVRKKESQRDRERDGEQEREREREKKRERERESRLTCSHHVRTTEINSDKSVRCFTCSLSHPAFCVLSNTLGSLRVNCVLSNRLRSLRDPPCYRVHRSFSHFLFLNHRIDVGPDPFQEGSRAEGLTFTIAPKPLGMTPPHAPPWGRPSKALGPVWANT